MSDTNMNDAAPVEVPVVEAPVAAPVEEVKVDETKVEAPKIEELKTETKIENSPGYEKRPTNVKFDATLLPESNDPAEIRKQVCAVPVAS